MRCCIHHPPRWGMTRAGVDPSRRSLSSPAAAASSVGRKVPVSALLTFDWVMPARRAASAPDSPASLRSARSCCDRGFGLVNLRVLSGRAAVVPPVLRVRGPVVGERDGCFPGRVPGRAVARYFVPRRDLGTEEPAAWVVVHPDGPVVADQPEVLVRRQGVWFRLLGEVEDPDVLAGGGVVRVPLPDRSTSVS